MLNNHVIARLRHQQSSHMVQKLKELYVNRSNYWSFLMNHGKGVNSLLKRKELLISLQRKLDIHALSMRQLSHKKLFFFNDNEPVKGNELLQIEHIISLDNVDDLLAMFKLVEMEIEVLEEVHNAYDEKLLRCYISNKKKEFFLWIKLIRYIEEKIFLYEYT